MAPQHHQIVFSFLTLSIWQTYFVPTKEFISLILFSCYPLESVTPEFISASNNILIAFSHLFTVSRLIGDFVVTLAMAHCCMNKSRRRGIDGKQTDSNQPEV